MKEFTGKHEDRIHGVLSCFDRMLFRGYLPTLSRSCKGLVHVKGHLLAHHVETRTGQLVGHRLDGHNAIRFRPLTLIERPDLRIETHGKVGRLNKGPGQILIPSPRVADTLLLAVAEP
jgi:hypothetical protein